MVSNDIELLRITWVFSQTMVLFSVMGRPKLGNTLSGENKVIFELLSLMQPSGVINLGK